MYSSLHESMRHRAPLESPSQRPKVEPRRLDSYRKSHRKPIFENSFYYSAKKEKLLARPTSAYDQSYDHIQLHPVHDDFCGCEHNLLPCPIIKQLLTNLTEKDMRAEYERLERAGCERGGRSRVELRRQFFRSLPAYYPEIYHAQLANLLANLEQEPTPNEFLTLAWIEYHAKYEYLTYFLFADLRAAQKPRKKFIDSLELALIPREVALTVLLQDAQDSRIPLTPFLEAFHETFAANVVPLSQYGRLIRLLLKHGCKILIKLLVLLLTTKKAALFELLRTYSNQTQFREKSRALLWEEFFEEVVAMKER